jgi:tetraacyldisaccharide 4'-kinase
VALHTTPRREGPWGLWASNLSRPKLALWYLLVPAALAYSAATKLRAAKRRRGAHHSDIATISVGNLTVGGNGKTPFTLFLAARLAARGLAAGIVSRGYRRRRRGTGARLIADRGQLLVSAEEAGDEPAMMARAFDGPIAVGSRRNDAIDTLKRHGALDVVVLDDAFQHLRLRRDIDLVLVNAERGFGNGWTIPAGPMREALSALGRADGVVLTHSGAPSGSGLLELLGMRVEENRLMHAVLNPRSLVAPANGGWQEVPLSIAARRVVAVSAIANPGSFYRMLAEAGAEVTEVFEYPDHYRYSRSDWNLMLRALHKADMVITTEKDLAKLELFPFPADSLYALRLEVRMEPEEARKLDRILEPALGLKTGERHRVLSQRRSV